MAQHPVTPFPLGRVLDPDHDPRSLAHPAPADLPVLSVKWPRLGKVLDQGNVGSCVGNASAQSLNHRAFYRRYHDETDARDNIYALATRLDTYPGSYPSQDTGSDGLAGAKACQQLGYIGSYTHAFGLDHVLAALQTGPLIVGTPWYNDMFNPDSHYRVHPTGGVAGGHEYVLDGVNTTAKTLRFLNSWSDQWGYMGRFYMSYADFSSLLSQQGDATLFAL